MRLTTEQQELVQNGSWVVSTVLKRFKRQRDDDLRQDAQLFMCKLVTTWDESKGRKWTSYAYQRLYFFVLHTLQRENKGRARELLCEIIPDRAAPSPDENAMYSCEIIDELYKRLTDVQCEVLYLLVQGCTHKDINKKLGVSYKRITQIVSEIKTVARVIRREWNTPYEAILYKPPARAADESHYHSRRATRIH